ncbi:heme exporter protein CcmD [Paraconexibacter sp.]|uniref:heme exporter protein CcmD n=1 Tax=Paraconexibacter sp. TaxID=2949640 RepID=UPI0035673D64
MNDVLPDNAGYVAAAYLVFLALLIIYFAITAIRVSRLERELLDLHRIVDEGRAAERDPAHDDAATSVGS